MIREETSTCQRVTDLAASPSRSSRPRVVPLWAGVVRPTPRSAQLPPSAAVFKDGRPAERGKKNLGQTFLSCVFLALGEAIHVSACPMSREGAKKEMEHRQTVHSNAGGQNGDGKKTNAVLAQRPLGAYLMRGEIECFSLHGRPKR